MAPFISRGKNKVKKGNSLPWVNEECRVLMSVRDTLLKQSLKSGLASGSMTSPWMLASCFLLASVLSTAESVTTTDSQTYTCRTFGSGLVQPFNGTSFYVRSDCPFTLTRFTHKRVGCDVIIRRDDSGLLVQLEIIINKVKTVVQDGSVLVEEKSVSLPYDHTYQHIFQYGIYTRLRSSLLPLSVTWHSVPGGIDTVKVELEQELSADMSGLCGKHTVLGNKQQLITESVLAEDTCQTRDPVSDFTPVCRNFFSIALDCLLADTPLYLQLCEENIHGYENSKYIGCAFFKEMVEHCGNKRFIWQHWRSVTKCEEPRCPGNLVYTEEGQAFLPSCSNPNPTLSDQELISSCLCPEDNVLNDHADGYHCVPLPNCSCVFAGKSYINGDIRSTKCQSCVCDSGKWQCSENLCPTGCVIEGQFVTTFDGKQYVLPGKCTYVASQGLNWTISIVFSEKAPSLTTVVLQVFQEMYTFSKNMVTFEGQEITELHQSEHALVFWQSSMYVQVYTSTNVNFQVQMSPEIQLYISAPSDYIGLVSGLCGNSNNDTTDDFRTSSGIIENSAQPFSWTWSVGDCGVDIPPTCINSDNEIFADEKCSVLNNPTGIFAKCHDHIPTDHYHTACIQRTCNCGSSLTQCLCVALGSYAKACARQGVVVGDWRKATNCTLQCHNNLEFSYDMQTCNRTCRSLSGSDLRCGLVDSLVEGCGCPEGTHLNNGKSCIPKAECPCYYHNGATDPGSVIIDGRQCICEDGELHCSKDCGCTNGKVCVHCSENPMNTTQKTCDSISKPTGAGQTCASGCYCPYDQYEDHNGNCVSLSSCTCVYSGKVFSAGQQVKTNCRTCICGQGQWQCQDKPCPGQCQVYGNGHYQTFDSKWYRFAGQCQYTLVEDDCGTRKGTFSVRVESVPCCDEALTCSRSIILDLQGKVTLTLSDMKVTRRLHKGWTLQEDSLYSTHTLGLYIVISVPSKGITLIWDKHTRLTIELHEHWKNQVCGLCGNFDSNEMNDLLISGSAVSSPLAFGNSWKAASPPCSDVTTEIFPCERNSYCLAWAQRRCRILTGDTFKDCHLKVDPDPYYFACVQESCSCEFEGKFLGFCTAVAAYAEACSDQDVCVKWRTPDLCPVYCDYYNEQGQCSWHYEACGEMLSCGKDNLITHKLEGCYPRCSKDEPYYDEHTGECTKLRNCTCYFNGTIIQPWSVVMIQSFECRCENGKINCPPTSTPTTPTASTTVETESTTLTMATSTPTTTTASTTAETESTTLTTPTSTQTTTTSSTTTETESTTLTTPMSTPTPTTSGMCECKDLKRKKRWDCGETWTEDCFHKTCADGKIELTSVVCPELPTPNCPRNQFTKVWDGCCETVKCNCRCELYGDPHYITFDGVNFDFLLECTHVLVEERSPRHSLTIAVENKDCVDGLLGSCVKSVILKYQNNTAILSIALNSVQATLNNVTIQPPYEEHGFSFETTSYTVSIYLPEIRSFVSLSSSYVLVVNLAMEHFLNNTQGQCGVCGGGSCVRKGGQLEDDSCCDKTAHGWVYADPMIPACAFPSSSKPCFSATTKSTPTTTVTSCPASSLCELLDHPVFYNCSKYVNLNHTKKNCEFDSCRTGPCSSLEQAAMECMNAGFCVDWRALTPGSCTVPCPNGLVFRECRDKLDDFCYGGMVYPGASLGKGRGGCFCPSGFIKSGNHSNTCVLNCSYCKGPLGEIKLPGEEWESNCHICKCNNQTLSEECVPKPLDPAPQCSHNSTVVKTHCCKQICVEKTCSYREQTYQVGDRWRDADHPCMSHQCSREGVQTETRVCPQDKCPEVTGINVTINNCTAVMQIPVCQGYCTFEPRVDLHGDLVVVTQQNNCCQTHRSEEKQVTLQCSDLTTRTYSYQHITGCECKACSLLL
ncbi:mucin-6 [Clinocottus analis]|uniref:mucin-6 n=1 Tax=Clinocottus analis TaxID=304258 RepID=UPI0035C1E80D